MAKQFLKGCFIVLVLTISFLGCSKDEGNPVSQENNTNSITGSASITLNGGTFSNKTFSGTLSTAHYQDTENLTVITFFTSSDTDSLTGTVVFPGKTSGTINWDGTTDNSGVTFYMGKGMNIKGYTPVSGSTKVNSYGNIGQFIEGTFTGKVLDVLSNTEINVNGSFKSRRI